MRVSVVTVFLLLFVAATPTLAGVEELVKSQFLETVNDRNHHDRIDSICDPKQLTRYFHTVSSKYGKYTSMDPKDLEIRDGVKGSTRKQSFKGHWSSKSPN